MKKKKQLTKKSYCDIYDISPLAIGLFSLPAFSLIDVNAEAAVLTGFTKEELLNGDSRQFFSSEEPLYSADKWRFHMEKAAVGEPQVFEWKIRKKHNPAGLVEVDLKKAIIGGEELIIAFLKKKHSGLSIDENLPELDHFSSVIEQFPYPIIKYAPDGSYITANLAWETMWHDKRQNVKGYNILRDVQLMESPMGKDIRFAFEGNIAEAGPYMYDPALIGESGRKRWIAMTLYPLKDAEGNILEMIVILRDITAARETEQNLVESEQRLRNTLDNMLEGAQIISYDWKYLYVNESLAKQAKTTRVNLIGGTMMEKFPGIENSDAFSFYTSCMHDRISHRLENEFTFPDNSRGWFELSIQPVPEGIFILSVDITARKRAEAKIMKLNESLEKKVNRRTTELSEANKELESFTYTASHDLRAPLRAINGYAGILHNRYAEIFDAEAKRLLKAIHDNAVNMGLLIEDLLAFSSLGRRQLHKVQVDPAQLVEQVLAEMKVSLKHNAQITVGKMAKIPADAALLKQVLMNLISNAIKYSAKKERPQVSISFEMKSDEAVFAVSDNGAGFDMQYYDKLFIVFQRLHNISEFEGTGVGLAIVDRIISKHGGKVWAHSKPGEGAVFYFSVPLHDQ